jgi:dTDP-glucose pyrophosphorylase
MTNEVSTQLVIPMAGRGQRFIDGGYKVAKPLLEIHGVPMYQLVVANLITPYTKSISLVCPSSWGLKEEIEGHLRRVCGDVSVLEIDYTTNGPAETVALAAEVLDDRLPLIVANSDQFVNTNMADFNKSLVEGKDSGLILTMEDNDAKWSYALLDESNKVIDVVEKEIISPYATVGIYGFKTLSGFKVALAEMKASGSPVNGEWYVGPMYPFLNRIEGPVGASNLGPVSQTMFGMGIPVDYENFLIHPLSRVASDHAKKLFG